MIKRVIAILLAWSCGFTALHATNVVTVKGTQGDVGKQVEISVEMSTDADDVAAAEIRIPLPEGVTTVDGSCRKVDSRLPSHNVTGNLNGNEYVIVIFNSNLTTIPTGSGKAISFKLNLGENPGVFDLTPRVKLSDTSGKLLQANAKGETLTILGAKLELGETDIDFGRVPIRGTYTKTVKAKNTGTATLILSEFTTDVPGLTVTSDSQSVEPNGSATLTLDYQPTERAASIAGRFTAVSNSVGRAPFVRVTSVPFSINELHVGSAEGISDSEVTIAVNMNNMEPIVGAEVSFKLPEGLEYVDGSLAPSSRASSFTASANFGADRNLRIVLFNLSNKAATGDDGELLTFKLKLTGRSGRYSLTPQNVILSNSASENMVSATSVGTVNTKSPSMRASGSMDIGNVPLNGKNTFDYTIENVASVPLTIEKVQFLNDVAECNAEFPIIIDSNSRGIIPVTIPNPKFGEFVSTMNVYSNDPDNRMKAVAIKGNFYSANELTVEQSFENGKCVLTAGLKNETEIVALQLDIIMPSEASELSDADLTLLSRAQSHSATLAKVGDNKYRIIIFSLTNAPFTGNSGGIFALNFDGDAIEGKQIRIENIKLSGKDGVNYTTPNTEVIVDNVPIAVRAIELSNSSYEVKVGESFTINATILPENASNKTVTWTSGEESKVYVDATGKVTAIALGEATITATCGSISAKCKITVIPTPVESITISNSTLSLTEGDKVYLNATITPSDATDKSVTWTSSDESVATVFSDGEVNAVKAGTATITASSSNGKTATCTVAVAAKIIEATTITLSETSTELKVGESLTLTATVAPENATDKTVKWSSSNDAIVSVDTNGKVYAKALGEATITATCGNVKASCKVTVIPTPVDYITLSNYTLNLKEGEKATITATVAPSDATDKSVTWKSSDDSVVSVSVNGEVTAVKAGTATITAASSNGKTAICTVFVAAKIVMVESLTIDPSVWNGIEGEEFTIVATVLPENADDKAVSFESSDESVATVDEEGHVKMLKEGTCVITVSTLDGSNLTAECEITIVTGVDEISGAEDTVDIFDMNGILIKHGCSSDELKLLTPGIYIIRSGNRTEKIVIR